MEYNECLVLIFVDYEKVFDTISQQSMLRSLTECLIVRWYGTIMKHIYENANACVRLREDTVNFGTDKGVRQGVVISSNLFIIFLETLFK